VSKIGWVADHTVIGGWIGSIRVHEQGVGVPEIHRRVATSQDFPGLLQDLELDIYPSKRRVGSRSCG
jgi:hypothetical protein